MILDRKYLFFTSKNQSIGISLNFLQVIDCLSEIDPLVNSKDMTVMYVEKLFNVDVRVRQGPVS